MKRSSAKRRFFSAVFQINFLLGSLLVCLLLKKCVGCLYPSCLSSYPRGGARCSRSGMTTPSSTRSSPTNQNFQLKQWVYHNSIMATLHLGRRDAESSMQLRTSTTGERGRRVQMKSSFSSFSSTSSSHPQSIAIIGSGPGGLATALMFLRKGWRNITIIEKLPYSTLDPSTTPTTDRLDERSYNIGLNGRGQVSLERLGAMERISNNSIEVRGRMEWGPRGADMQQREFTDRRYFTKVLLRNKLVQCLYEEVLSQQSNPEDVKFIYGVQVVDAVWEEGSNRVRTYN